MLVTCFFLTSAHIYPQVLFTAPLPPQVNRSSKSRAKRSDSERQRLMSRCQSLKESGAQAIAEKVDYHLKVDILKNRIFVIQKSVRDKSINS